MAVVIETTVGDITVDLFTDRRPQTCKNFLKLCKIKYYNFCLFHSIQANFIAQTGDPTGSGTGGESVFGVVHGSEKKYYEAEKIPKIKHNKLGLLSMVNCGNSMLGSQFFVTLGSDLPSLDEHCVFAEVTEGLDILVKLNDAICDHQHRPYQDIRITHTVILEDPYEDIPGLVVPDASPDVSSIETCVSRIGADEKINDEEGLTEGQLEEVKAEREAKARATILEIVGDLPDADFAPPENVLFVCKLNPVTTDDDLEIIFSRFGTVKSCEVIRDHTTGDSLQYAFVEFEDQRSCEQAFLKMDNVLIDDRRIHVDFSQSVSKIRWRGKGRGVQYLDKDENKESSANGNRHGKRDVPRDKERERDKEGRDRDRKGRDEDDRDRERRREEERRRRGNDRDTDDYRRRERRKEDPGGRRREDDSHRLEEDRRRTTAEEDRRRSTLEDDRRRSALEEDRRRSTLEDDRRRSALTEDDRRRGGAPAAVVDDRRRFEDERVDDERKRREREERRRDGERRYGSSSRRDERRREDSRGRRRGTEKEKEKDKVKAKKKNGDSRIEKDSSKDSNKDSNRSKDSHKSHSADNIEASNSRKEDSRRNKDRSVTSDVRKAPRMSGKMIILAKTREHLLVHQVRIT
uniref:Peptidyl-prolyl cis-trans isomerase n=1 Tax=Lygus hesperus TaxID=30085 RepID=A0A0A9ZB80_LYGHE